MPKEIFKITSAGSVDDGKSTILARLLLDTGSIYDDQLSKDFDPTKIADLLDGLESERDQGITIDVAHRFFDSNLRRYQIADSPGHEQYTRNMATACAGSDCLMLVIDARVGIKPQTKHHLEIAQRLGIRDVIFVVNKIDLVGFSKKAFVSIEKSIEEMLDEKSQKFSNVRKRVIPVSGLTGANVVKTSSRLKWFEGPTLLAAMDSVERTTGESNDGFLAVEYVQRISGGGRRYLGTLMGSTLKTGSSLFLGQEETLVEGILISGKSATEANPGQAIAVTLNKEIDIHPGSALTKSFIETHQQFEVDLVWLSSEKGTKGRRLILKSYGAKTDAFITKISTVDLNTDEKSSQASSIEPNQIVRCNLSLSSPVPLRNFEEDEELGKFILIDPYDGQTIASGTVNHPLRRGDNLTRHEFAVTSSEFAKLTGNKGQVIWFTGLSGSGKSTLANAVSKRLFDQGRPHYILDGDNLRLGINKDLGFTDQDRSENIRRTAEVAKLMADSGLIVLVSLVSPFNADRTAAKEIIGEDRFDLVFLNIPLEVCEDRDPKGLYKKARMGELPNLTGMGSVYETPENPDLLLTEEITLSNMCLETLNLIERLLGEDAHGVEPATN